MVFAVDTRHDYNGLAEIYLPIAIAVYVVVAVAVGWTVLRGRRRADPSKRKNNVPLELGYVAALVAVAALLVTLTFTVDGRIDAAGVRPAERVRVEVARWHWRFIYPLRGIAIQGTDEHAATLVVPQGQPVAFEGRSVDVIHGFWVPDQRFQRELFPDRITRWQMTFNASTSGTAGECSFFCGLDHQRMRFGVRVLPPDQYAAWVRSRGRV